mmetsp:Transcript_84254/g.235974  ORF Transcript_84254/g.235974 Transcript_84254/m.235974 type:complete len:254 (+) Transcript_84254:200-961(+)
MGSPMSLGQSLMCKKTFPSFLLMDSCGIGSMGWMNPNLPFHSVMVPESGASEILSLVRGPEKPLPLPLKPFMPPLKPLPLALPMTAIIISIISGGPPQPSLPQPSLPQPLPPPFFACFEPLAFSVPAMNSGSADKASRACMAAFSSACFFLSATSPAQPRPVHSPPKHGMVTVHWKPSAVCTVLYTRSSFEGVWRKYRMSIVFSCDLAEVSPGTFGEAPMPSAPSDNPTSATFLFLPPAFLAGCAITMATSSP